MKNPQGSRNLKVSSGDYGPSMSLERSTKAFFWDSTNSLLKEPSLSKGTISKLHSRGQWVKGHPKPMAWPTLPVVPTTSMIKLGHYGLYPRAASPPFPRPLSSTLTPHLIPCGSGVSSALIWPKRPSRARGHWQRSPHRRPILPFLSQKGPIAPSRRRHPRAPGRPGPGWAGVGRARDPAAPPVRAQAPGARPGPLRPRQPGRDTWCLGRPRSGRPRPLGLGSLLGRSRGCGRCGEKGGDRKGGLREVGRRDVGAVRAARGGHRGPASGARDPRAPSGSLESSGLRRRLFPGAARGGGAALQRLRVAARWGKRWGSGASACTTPFSGPPGIPERLRVWGRRPPRGLHSPLKTNTLSARGDAKHWKPQRGPELPFRTDCRSLGRFLSRPQPVVWGQLRRTLPKTGPEATSSFQLHQWPWTPLLNKVSLLNFLILGINVAIHFLTLRR